MVQPESALHDLREHYALIFNWHREHGPRRYRERFQGEIHPDATWFKKYMHLLERMPHPLEADAEAIAHVAHEVLTGCMEWSYGEKVLPDLSMSEVAKAIQRMLKELERKDEDGAEIEKLEGLQNMGETGSAPTCVEVRVPLSAFEPGDTTYLEYARIAYNDVPTPSEDVSLGGFVALADTNIEVQARHGKARHGKARRSIHGNQGHMLFRNAKALHMIEDTSEDSLVGFAKSGAISILSVRIGGEH